MEFYFRYSRVFDEIIAQTDSVFENRFLPTPSS